MGGGYARYGHWLDRGVVVVYWLAIVVGCYLGHQSGHWSALRMFGWEYGNIAESLARGEGFAGAMARGSGPTAWMPPLLAWIYALLFLALGIRSEPAVLVAYGLKSAGMAATVYLLLRLLRQTRWAAYRWPLYVLPFLFLWLDQLRVFFEIEDVWLQNLMVCVALQGLLHMCQDGTRLTPSILAAAVLLPLVSPVSTAAFYCCALAVTSQSLRRGLPVRAQVLALALSLVVSGGWTLRNKVALGQAYPIKSNMWFDYVEANLWDDDGILTDSIFFRYHPVNPNSFQDQYRMIGEKAFLDVYHQEATRVPLLQWVQRSLRRLVNATVFLIPEIDVVSALDLGVPDQCQLAQAGLIGYSRGQPLWQFCAWDEDRFARALEVVPLQNRPGVLRSRAAAHTEYLTLYGGWDRTVWGLAHALAVTVAIVLILACPTLRKEPLPLLAIGFYALYLVPYILVSHYERYQVSATGAQMLLLTLAYCALRADGSESKIERSNREAL